KTARLLEVIRGRNSKTVGLQFPVGLRTKAVELAQEIEAKADVTCLVSADPSFGACDVADMPVDLIVHLGHAPMPHLRYNRVFFFDHPGPRARDCEGSEGGAGPRAPTAPCSDRPGPRCESLWDHRLEEDRTGANGDGHGFEGPRREARKAGESVPHGSRRPGAAPRIPCRCVGQHGVPANCDRRHSPVQAADSHAAGIRDRPGGTDVERLRVRRNPGLATHPLTRRAGSPDLVSGSSESGGPMMTRESWPAMPPADAAAQPSLVRNILRNAGLLPRSSARTSRVRCTP